jgi:hypothetical protein
MKLKEYVLMSSLLFFVVSGNTQVVKFGFQKLLNENAEKNMPFAVVNNGESSFEVLMKNNVEIKFLTQNWIYITTTPKKLNEMVLNGSITDFHFEFGKAVNLNDSTRVKHFVNEVHSGSNGLPLPFTGKDVILGVIDAGLDFNHPDFKDAQGNSRVLFYWDQSLTPQAPFTTPQPYNYGLEFTNQQINSGLINLSYSTSHGTISAGIAAGNGLANGENKGMAPDANIIFVNYSGGTLSFSDACDYIFKKADALGKACVINLSVGFYLGSHDGNDPATELVESLLDAKPGRIITVAAGNSGAWEPYHVRGNVSSAESFVWFENRPSQSPYTGLSNTIMFDLWSDLANIQNLNYSFGVNLPNGSFSQRASTPYRSAINIGSGVFYDTLRNANGDQLATIESYPSFVNGAYNLLVLFSKIDSTSYYYSFKTQGSGMYDLWSSPNAGVWLNKIITDLPSSSVYPPIVNYHAPDLNQTIVSGFACSEKILTVGNIVNLTDYISLNGNLVSLPPGGFFSNQLSPNSSKGPTRLNVLKPNISATGDYSFAPATLAELADSNSAHKVSASGWHLRSGGTSAAAPVVCGISALYLERCKNANYQDFINDLHASAFSSQYAGVLPNNSYGYGYANALGVLLKKNYTTEIIGNELICSSGDVLSIGSSNSLDSVVWKYNSTSQNTLNLSVNQAGTYYSFSYDSKACVETDTISLILGTILDPPTISDIDGVLTASLSPNYQWYMNGNLLNGQTFQVLIGTYNPNASYTVAVSSPDGCIVFSEPFGVNSIDEHSKLIKTYPNPSSNYFEILGINEILNVVLLDINGKAVLETNSTRVDVSELVDGIYFVKIVTKNEILHTKFERF